jgi:anti-sigma regulatory factor (Ser/Thr protein kinase)
VTTRVRRPHELVGVRGLVTEVAAATGLDADRCARLAIAVNELVTNAITHGLPPATVTITSTGTDVLVAVHDGGGGFTEPDVVAVLPGDGSVAARAAPPGLEDVSGRGLWLAVRLCDHVDVRTDPAGTTVRVTMRGALA